MGGFCALREKCANYLRPQSRHNPAERLCVPGRDGMLAADLAALGQMREAAHAAAEAARQARIEADVRGVA